MKLYIVRHGESDGNAAKRFMLDRKGGLTRKGIRQAEKLAKRFKKLPVDVIISSDFKRATDTARIISKAIGKKVVITKLIREQKYPKEYKGRQADDLGIERIRAVRKRHMNERDWHYSDEENFFDLETRVEKLLKFISKRKEKHILAVGHGITMRMIIARIIFGNILTPKMFQPLRTNLLIQNTGITVCEKTDKGWSVLTWNDHAHFG